jgi:haloalkane dehalogenase
MKVLRTPDERFADLRDFPFRPHYWEVPDGEGGKLRIHFIDEGPRNADVVLLMHGEPSWSFLYRKMIPIFVKAGLRAIAPDLVGFGRSDKPASRHDYTYQRHVDWVLAFIDQEKLDRMTLVCQDWGGLVGLRLLAARPHLFDRVVVANTGLPTGGGQITEAFLQWRKFSQEAARFDIGAIIKAGCQFPLTDEIVAAYDAPFPDDSYKEGARIFPSLVPIAPDDPAVPANLEAWKVLSAFEKPFLTAFSDGDPVTRGGENVFQSRVPGAKGQPHTTIQGAGHFLQEDKGEEFAAVILGFISRTSSK